MKKPATLRDVAAAAFVSVSTASMALSGSTSVAAETRERVKRAAIELNYRPDATARALRGGSRQITVGLYVDKALTEDFGSASRLFAHRLVRLITDRLAAKSVPVHQFVESTDPRIADLSVLVVVSDQPPNPAIFEHFRQVKIVMAGYCFDGPTPSNVVAQLTHDQSSIARDVVGHISAQGARCLHIVRFREAAAYSQTGAEAVVLAAESAGLDVGVSRVNFDPGDVERATREAVLTGADAIFLMLPYPGAAIAGIRAAGARVPEDVLLVGRGEGTLEAETSPPTSAMSMMAVRTGELIAAVVERAVGGEVGIRETAPHCLIERASSLRNG